MPDLELNLAPTAEDMPEMAIALIPEGGLSRFEAMAQIAEPGRSCPGALPDRVDADMSDWQEERRRRDRARRDEVLRLPVLQVRRHGVIAGPDGDVLVCASVGPAGEAVAVWTTPEDRETVTTTTVSAAGASFPDPGAARPVGARITVHAPDLAAVTPIADLTLAHITVQPMPGGRFLAELSADRAQPAGEYRVVLPGGEPIPAGTQIIGRGSRLHFLTGTSWYQLGIGDIPA